MKKIVALGLTLALPLSISLLLTISCTAISQEGGPRLTAIPPSTTVSQEGDTRVTAMPPSTTVSQEGDPRITATSDTTKSSADRAEKMVREATTHVTIVTKEDLERYPSSDLAALLRREGLVVIGHGVGSEIIIRGVRYRIGGRGY